MRSLPTAVGAIELTTAPIIDGEFVEQPPDPQRQAWLDGMRAIVDWLEANPQVPLPFGSNPIDGRIGRHGLGIYVQDHTYPWEDPGPSAVQQVATIAKAMGRATKGTSRTGARMYVYRPFGPIDVFVGIDREQVCERVVVGTKTETELVPDPAAPKVEQTRTVEIVEWRCGSVLSAALEAGGDQS